MSGRSGMPTVLRVPLDVVRGALMGVAEVIPGVSGGTVALVVGVYEAVIGSAGHLVRGIAAAIVDPFRGRGLARSRTHLAQVRWGVVIPVGIGMLLAIVAASAIVAPLVEERPVETRAVFTGLIVASLIVPARMVGRWGAREVLLALAAAVLAVVLVGLPPVAEMEPALWLVAPAAAAAVCALVLPGVSGSFVLLTVGMYAPTLAAVNDRDYAYLGVFAVGAIIGLAAFVPTLQWLLEHRRRVTLAIMTGLLAGSLRALWPWQSEDGALEPAGSDAGLALLLALAGAAVVVALLIAERLVTRRTEGSGPADPAIAARDIPAGDAPGDVPGDADRPDRVS